MKKIVQYGSVSDGGKLSIHYQKRFLEEVKMFKGCEVEIIVKKKGKRTLPQNAYYWGVVVYEIRERLKDLGHRVDSDTVHEFLKQKFNPEVIVVPETAEAIEIGASTTEMNKSEFSDYVERVKEWASMTLEIYIPDAGEQTKMYQE